MGLSGSTVLSIKTNFSSQLLASSVVVYKLLGPVTAPLFGHSPYISPKSDSPVNT